jgi:hypothetical protein
VIATCVMPEKEVDAIVYLHRLAALHFPLVGT